MSWVVIGSGKYRKWQLRQGLVTCEVWKCGSRYEFSVDINHRNVAGPQIRDTLADAKLAAIWVVHQIEKDCKAIAQDLFCFKGSIEELGPACSPEESERRRAKASEFLASTRKQEKQKSRDQDEEDLRTGKKTPEQLQKENGHFAGLRVRINLKKAKKLY
jgi:hypothetical protein